MLRYRTVITAQSTNRIAEHLPPCALPVKGQTHSNLLISLTGATLAPQVSVWRVCSVSSSRSGMACKFASQSFPASVGCAQSSG